MKLEERFIEYTKYDTQSDEESKNVPSTEKQKKLAIALRDELLRLGLKDIILDDMGYLYATLPSNINKDVPTIGFIAHMDTSPSMSGKDVKARIVRHYDGEDIILDAKEGIVLSPSVFPELLNHKGESIIVTDGHTLLGADDKAGIAEIVSAVEYLILHPEIKHGKIRLGFNPDEEIGMGAANFNVGLFGCDWAYTVDGGEVGEMEFENFNAAKLQILIHGLDVHPGYAKNKMINALLIAGEISRLFPSNETPATTEGYEGFYHLISMSGSVDQAEMTYIIRDHDSACFEKRKEYALNIIDVINAKFGSCVAEANIIEQYRNMREMIEKVPYVVDLACEAMEKVGVIPQKKPIRGGTDGAQLSFKGLPCPNLFAGGMNFHGRYEYIPIESMYKAMNTIIGIIELVAKNKYRS